MSRPTKHVRDYACPLCNGPDRVMDPNAAAAHRRKAHPIDPAWSPSPRQRLRELNAAADRGETVDYTELVLR
jgi:hypothetical protein